MASLMIQGCGSDVGKSTLVAGLCRLFANRGLIVRPFKPQNMSNNAAVTADGGEIGRAQALQALACRTPPTVHMNPVLLKPQSDVGAQVVVRGKVVGAYQARAFQGLKPDLLATTVESYRLLAAEADLVLVEGAGSPAETNLRKGDIANMGFAHAADVPVALVGDIDRGHVIAALAGAHLVLDAADRDRIKGFIINKFRGDPSLFDEGRREIVARTGWPDLGMAPWLASARALPAEDAVVLERPVRAGGDKRVRIVVPMLSRIANFDEFDPLRADPDIDFAFLPPGTPVPGDADLVILPGTKATLADLAFLRAQGWDIDILAHVRRGGRVLGVCGGYQMLGGRCRIPRGSRARRVRRRAWACWTSRPCCWATRCCGRRRGGCWTATRPSPATRCISAARPGPARRGRCWPSTAAPCRRCGLGRRPGGGRLCPRPVRARRGPGGPAGAAGPGGHAARPCGRVDAALDEIAAMLERSLDIEAIGRIAGL
jgi:adenosylcobyric acid synthase